VGSALASCLCFSAGSAIWRSGVAEAVGAREDFVSRLAPPIVPSFLPCFGGDVSASSDSGAGGVGWGLAALRPPIVPSLDFGLGFSGDGVGDVWASIGGVDVGVGDLVRARPPSVPRRLRGEGADNVGGWGVWLFSREGSCDVDGVGFWEAWDGPSRSSSSSSVSSSCVKGPRVVVACAVGFAAGAVGDVFAFIGARGSVLVCLT